MANDTKIVVSGETSKYERAMKNIRLHSKRTTQAVQRQWKTTAGVFDGVTGKLLALAGAGGLGALGMGFLGAARESENFQVRLKVLLGSVEEGNKLFRNMEIYAGKVPFQYREIMGAATQLSGVMAGGVKEVTAWMPLIGDLAAASGLSIQQTTEQVVRMYSAGAASADLFRERGILAMLGFEAGVSYSADETRKQLVNMWADPASRFRGATTEMSETWDGMVSMIQDKWFQFRNIIMDAGVFDALKTKLGEINTRFGTWIENNESIIRQNIPKMIDDTEAALQKIWSVLTYDPDIMKYGLIGLAVGGKKGAVLFGGIAHMVQWSQNLSRAFELQSRGIIEFSAIAASNFKELEALIAPYEGKTFGVYTGKIPKQPLMSPAQDPPAAGSTANDMARIEALKNQVLGDSLSRRLTITTDHGWRTLAAEQEFEDQRMAGIERSLQWTEEMGRMYGEVKIARLNEEAVRQFEIERDLKGRLKELDEQAAAHRMTIAIGVGQAMLSYAGASTKQIFLIQKGVEVAQATMAAFTASNLALANPPGPPWTITLSKKVLTVGLMNAAAIAATSVGQMAMSSGGNVGGGTHTSPTVTTPVVDPALTRPQDTRGRVTINIHGDVLGDDLVIDHLVERINEASDREVYINQRGT